jgi:curved DNA-binding protein CbpA
MIATIDADNISRLLKQLSRDYSTENTIAFVADNGGMLSSCKKILTLCRDGSEEIREWVQKECGKYGVQYGWFLQEAGQILQIFQSDDKQDDSYGILGLSSSASLDEVKRAYRKLTVQYHPDTAGNAGRDTTEQFIRINKAYHTITTGKRQESVDEISAGTAHFWRYGKTESVPGRVNKKSIVWISVLILGSVLSCGLIAQIYSQKVMVSTLQHSGAAFVPTAKKTRVAPPVVAMTFAEKMKITETREKAEQAARQKESEADHAKRAEIVESPELKAVKASIPAEQEKTVAIPPQEVVQAIPSLSEVDSQKTKPVEQVKKTTELHSVETKAEKAKGKTMREAGDAKKNTVQTTKNTIAPDLKKEDSAELRRPAVERIARQDKQISAAPIKDAVKQEVAVQPVVEPHQAQETVREDSRSGPDVQQRIDTFLLEYCRAYVGKNLMEFTRFFELDATENGQPITELVGTYTNLFESTKTIGLQISTLKWEESPKGQITLNGRFKIDLVYQNAEVVHGRGKIDFLLVTDHGKLLVKKMNYSFDQ